MDRNSVTYLGNICCS